MTIALRKGAYAVRVAESAADVVACQRLRHFCFRGCVGMDMDRFDDLSRHLMVEDHTGV